VAPGERTSGHKSRIRYLAIRRGFAMRRRKLLTAFAGLAVLLAAGALVLWPRPDRITRDNFDRIKEGMTAAQVEAIVGPAGDCTTGPRIALEPPGPDRCCQPDPAHPVLAPTYASWITDKESVWIEFTPATGRVQEKHLMPVASYSNGVLDDLRWRVERQWRKWFP
jgi:hypothetical protein